MKIRLFVALSISVVGLLGCAEAKHVSTQAAGHSVNISVIGQYSVEVSDNRGLIASEFGRVTIEPQRVRLNDSSWTAILEKVPVEVRISRGKLSVAAGPTTTTVTVR